MTSASAAERIRFIAITLPCHTRDVRAEQRYFSRSCLNTKAVRYWAVGRGGSAMPPHAEASGSPGWPSELGDNIRIQR